jgi:DNA-binding NarL/FixJ family response regulator
MKESATAGLKLIGEAGLADEYRALFLRLLGDASWLEGDYEKATQLAEESLELSRETNDLGGIVISLQMLAAASMWGSGDLERARSFYEEGLAIARDLGSGSSVRNSLQAVGFTYLLQGDLERAKAFAEEAAALCREEGDRVLLPFPVSILGWVALLSGDLERAEALHKESLALSRVAGGSWGTPVFLEGLACTAGAKGEAEKAARLFGATQALREAMGVGPWIAPLVEPYLVGSRSCLEEGAWTEAWKEGQAMSMETAIEYALSKEEPSTASPAPGQSSPSTRGHPAELTPREVEVLGLVAEGLTNPQVAQRLFLSPRTVQRHLNSVYRKLGVSSRSAATRLALEHGLL